MQALKKYCRFFKQQPTEKFRLGLLTSRTDLTMVLTAPDETGRWNIVDFAKVPFPNQAQASDTEISVQLKYALRKFLKDHKTKDISIWATIQSNKVTTLFFEIPAFKKGNISKPAIWAFAQNSKQDLTDSICDFRVIGHSGEGDEQKLKIQGYAAPKSEVRRIQDIFLQAGYPLTGISSTPFGVQNIVMNRVPESEQKNVCVFFVGRDWTRIDVYSKGNLSLSRDIKTGFESLLESIRQRIRGGYLKNLLDI